jgi:phosphohistidine phosphatase
MELYLVRHAQAAAGPDDNTRRLSAQGEHQAETIAAWLATAIEPPAIIIHSPLMRATQTAEAIAGRLHAELRRSDHLKHDGDIHKVREWLADWADSQNRLMLVGHNPFMEDLAALLLCENAPRQVLAFKTSTAAKLVSADASGRRFVGEWLISAHELLRRATP